MLKNYAAILMLLLVSCSTNNRQNFADKIYYNGKIYTCDSAQLWVNAIAVKDDKIIYAGNDYNQYKDDSTQLIDLKQQLVVPGFTDAHVHFLSSGANLAGIDLRYASSKQEFIQKLKQYITTVPGDRWITGGNWDHERWGGDLPTKEMIDSISGNHPVAISRLDGHMILANSLALKKANINAETNSPDGGTIVKDISGNPTGILKDNAQDMVFSAMPAPAEQQLDENFLRAQQYALSLGVTQVNDMGSFGGYPEIETYRRTEKNGLLKMRLYAFAPLSTWQKLHDYVQANGKGDDWVKWGGLKGFADGSLGSTTAWFYQPYLDMPGSTGLMVTDTTDMRNWILAADSVHLQIAVHAIGDRANDFILSCFEQAEKRDGKDDQRFRIEHAQHLSINALTKFTALKAIPSMQPYHAIDDGRWAHKRIDSDRISRTYAFRTLLNNKTMLAFGTDWDVAPLNPLPSIYAAVTRRTLDDKNPGGWVPEQKISVGEAVYCYTAGSAYAGFNENKTGKLKAGMLADFVVLDKNIFEINPVEIKDAKVLRTIVGGKEMFVQQ